MLRVETGRYSNELRPVGCVMYVTVVKSRTRITHFLSKCSSFEKTREEFRDHTGDYSLQSLLRHPFIFGKIYHVYGMQEIQ